MTEIDHSLRRLGTDYVDLYQIHRWDPQSPIEETLEALHDVVKAGKARYIGASSMYAWQFAKALYVADLNGWTRFVSHAEPLQPALPRGGARDAPALRRPGHRRHPVEPAGARPADPRLGRGRPTAPRPTSSARRLYARGRPRRSSSGWPRSPQARGVPRAQVALAWVLAEPGRHRADRRRDQAAAPRRTPSRRSTSSSPTTRSPSSRSRTPRTASSGSESERPAVRPDVDTCHRPGRTGPRQAAPGVTG